MISLFGFTLSATAPWLLVGVPVGLAALVYIYRTRDQVVEQVVSTLLLLRLLPERYTSRRRFFPPLQFWIDLAVLALLSLAAAGILAIDASKRIAIVVDSSLSMAARAPSGTTRLADAIRLASADAVGQIGSTRFTVYSAGGTLTKVSEPDVSASAATAALSSISQTFEPDRIDSALRNLLSEGTFDAVWAYTDRPLANSASSATIRVTTIPSDPASVQNTWIRSVEASSTALAAQISTIGRAADRTAVSAQCFSENGTAVGSPLSTSLSASSGTAESVSLSPLPSEWKYCKVTAQPRDSSADLLSVDNEAWVARSAQRAAIQVLSPLTLGELGLNRISGYSFMRLPAASDPLFSPNSSTIVHRMSPPKKLTAPLLVVVPPAGKLPWGGESGPAVASGIAVTRWDASHPLLQYVKPTLISAPSALSLTCDAGAQEILSSSSGALACAGERGGQRYLVTSLELFPFDGAASPTVSILTLNSMKWLFGAESAAGNLNFQPGRVSLPAGATSVRYLAPTPSAVPVSADGRVTLPSPGIISFVPPQSREAELRAVTIFSDEESDLSRQRAIEVPAQPAAVARRGARAPLPIAPWLAALALLVLAVDVFRRIRGRTSWGMR